MRTLILIIICAATATAQVSNVSNWRLLTDVNKFSGATYNRTSILDQRTPGTLGSTVRTFRLGSPKSFFETIQRSQYGSLNEVRLRTDETTPCCGGFAEVWLLSDTTHSYLYLRAQRYITYRSDDHFWHNFKSNSKFKMGLELDDTGSYPNEDNSRFRVGNYVDNNLYFSLTYADRTAALTGEKIIINPTLSVPVSASAPCITGQVEYDASHLYVCVATDTWRRASLSTF